MKGLTLSLLDALKNTPEPKEPKSKIAAILLAVSHEEQASLVAALTSPEWTHERLAEVLTDSGHPVAEASVRRYRRNVMGLKG